MPETRSTSEAMVAQVMAEMSQKMNQIVAQTIAEMSQKMKQIVQTQSENRAHFTGMLEEQRGEMQELKLSQAKADFQNDAEEKSSSDQHQYVSLSTKPDLIFDDTTKIVAGVNDEDLDGIDFDLYSDLVSEDATEGVVCDDPILLVESAPENSIKSLDILSDLTLVKPTTGYIVYTDDFSIVSGLNKREIVGWNEASGLENLFGVLCNTLSSCLPTVCENASVYLPSVSLAHETFNGNWCSIQLFYMAAVCPNPPWEPPDDRNYPLLCVDNDLVLSKPTAIGTPRLGMGSSNSDIGLEDLALDSDSTSPIEKLVKYGMSNLDEGLFMGESLLKELEGLSKYKGTGKQHISSNENRPHLVDSILYSSLIDGPCKDGREKNALDMFSLMVEKGREPTLLTYNSLIEGLCHEDVMLNDESKQETPAVVCFGEKQRFIGTAGAASTMINPKNAISQIKRLIGRQFSDPELQKNLAGFPFCVKEGQDGYPLINVQYLGETRSFTPTQLLGMVLSILKALAHPYFKGLAKIEREPPCQPISKLEFEFERRMVTKDDVRELIFREILEHHPNFLKDYLNFGWGLQVWLNNENDNGRCYVSYFQATHDKKLPPKIKRLSSIHIWDFSDVESGTTPCSSMQFPCPAIHPISHSGSLDSTHWTASNVYPSWSHSHMPYAATGNISWDHSYMTSDASGIFLNNFCFNSRLGRNVKVTYIESVQGSMHDFTRRIRSSEIFCQSVINVIILKRALIKLTLEVVEAFQSMEVVIDSSLSDGRLDWVKNLRILLFETAFLNLGFSLSLNDHAIVVRYITKFIMFSLPRPPEVGDLEDKVNFKAGGMLHIQISNVTHSNKHKFRDLSIIC